MFSFDSVVGNKFTVGNFKRSIENEKILHSYMILGEDGLGKFFIANCFAKMLLCERNDACGQCYSCKSFETGNNPDIIYVRAVKTNSIGVDDIREQVKNQAIIKPYVCRYKIFIIEKADTMTVQAQNALLKILEEPPEYVIFFLLGERKNNFLPTIISRCTSVRINPVTKDEVYEFLISKDVSPQKAQICSVYSKGNIGRALQMSADEDFIDLRKKFIALCRQLKSCNCAEAMLFTKRFEEVKEKIDLVLDIIYLWYSDLIIYRNDGERFISNVDLLEELKEDISFYENLYDKVSAIDKTKKYLRFNTNFKLTINVLLMDLCGR